MSRRGVVIAIIVGGLIFFLLSFHVIWSSSGLTVIPKEHLSFADTFMSLETLIHQYNERSAGEKLRGEGVNLYLVRKLQEKALIRPTNTPEPSLPASSAPTGQATFQPPPDWERKTRIKVRGQEILLGLHQECVRERLRAAGISEPVRTETAPDPKLPDSSILTEHYEIDGVKFALVFERPAKERPYWVVEIQR
jgi:hypothetical protein